MSSPFDPGIFDPAIFGSNAIGTGTVEAFIVGDNKLTYGYWVQSGAIKGEIRDPAGNIVVPEFTAIASGVDDAPITVDESRLQDGVWRIVMHWFDGGALKENFSNDGQNFS